MTKRLEPFVLTVLVALGWYATVVGAAIVGEMQVADDSPDCAGFCGPGAVVMAAAVFGPPIMAGVVVFTLLLAILMARAVSSTILAGTLTAAPALLVAAVFAGRILQLR